MIHLAIETSTSVVELALLEEERVLCSRSFDRPGGASEILVEAVGDLLASAGRAIAEIVLVSSSSGPGTYTSLRVGHLFAQGLSYSLGVPHRTVSPFQVLAVQALERFDGDADFLVVLLDARRGEVNACLFEVMEKRGPLRRSLAGAEGPFSGRAVDPEFLLSHLPPGKGVLFGPGVPALEGALEKREGERSRLRRISDLPKAETMGLLAFREWRTDPGTPVRPLLYGRDSVIS